MRSLCNFISTASNTVANGVAWLEGIAKGPILVFATHNQIAVADFDTKSILCTLKGHSGRVTSVSKLTSAIDDQYVEIVSSGEDGRVIVWRHFKDESLHVWHMSSTLVDLATSVTCHSSITTSYGCLISASNSKGRLVTWFRPYDKRDDWAVVDLVDLPPAQMPQCLSLVSAPALESSGNTSITSVFLLVGAVDSRVHIRVIPAFPDRAEYVNRSFMAGNLSGHEDWITSLSGGLRMPGGHGEDLYFASGSQDSKIRIWKISPSRHSSAVGVETFQECTDPNQDSDEDEEECVVQQPTLSALEDNTSEARCTFLSSQYSSAEYSSSENVIYSVYLETLLVGHEDWVTSVHWMPGTALRLFTTSMDRNMVIWRPDDIEGVWLPTTRMGDIGGNLGGSVGGNLLGFVGGCAGVADNTESIIGIGYGGSFHLWQSDISSTPCGQGGECLDQEAWRPVPFITGHFGAVRDVIWGPNEDHVLSVSSDQTCRLFAPVRSQQGMWRELSRPQIHGYDLSCIQMAHFPAFCFYSGGDEKAIRAFQAPLLVLEGLHKLSGNTAAGDVVKSEKDGNHEGSSQRIHSAYIPELGLSNKPASQMSADEAKEQASRGVESLNWEDVPLEGQLADHTIWPETHKMHGHRGDVVCLTASKCGQWIASAAKGRDATSSAILVWETKRMVCVAALPGHESTVTALEFSENSRYLISGGKDRALCMYEATPGEPQPFTVSAFLRSAHKRIIWDVTWFGDGSNAFATASRDGHVKLWAVESSVTSSPTPPRCEMICKETFSPFSGTAVTAICGTKTKEVECSDVNNKAFKGWLLAVGGECGGVSIWNVVWGGPTGEYTAVLLHNVSDRYAHGASVRCLRWKEDFLDNSNDNDVELSCGDSGSLKLASGGDDHCVRVFSICLH